MTVVIVGGGIAGLTAALEAASLLPEHEVVLREAGDVVGGHIRTTPFAGRDAVDEAADAFLARVPHATQLAERVGLADELTSPTPARAAIWHDRLHPIPDGIVLGVPADLTKLAASRLLSWRGKLRAGLDLVLPARDPGDSIGALVRSRFGSEVHDRLVDALVGSIYAADTDRFSLAMVPQLDALASSGRSILVAARQMQRAQRKRQVSTADGSTAVGSPSNPPIFAAPLGGMGRLVTATAGAAIDAGVRIQTAKPVESIEPDGSGWRIDDVRVDGVIVAAPARHASTMLAGTPSLSPLVELLDRIDVAGVALVTLAVPRDRWAEHLADRSGYLVPKSVQQRVTAVSFLSQKWRHLADERTEIIRVSIGRDRAPFDDLDDDGLVSTAVDEVDRQLGVSLQPAEARVSRWPIAFPQYRPGHTDWLSALERAAPAGLAFAGASYRGIGIPACIDQGLQAARAVAAHVAEHRA